MNKNDCKNIPKRAQEGDITCDRAGCHFAVIPGSNHCAIHHSKTPDLYQIDRAQVSARLQTMRHHPDANNLEVELALIRHILETLLKQCQDGEALLRNSGTIGSLVDKVQNLLTANIRAGQITGSLLTIEEVVTIAQDLVSIVAEYVDEEDVQEIMSRFQESLEAHV